MSDEARPDPGVTRAYLDEVELELDAVRRLTDPPNRLATYHLSQAAEKLVKAVRLDRGLHATREHRLEILIDDLPAEDHWRSRLSPLEHLSAYATSYRYPTTRGRVKSGLGKDDLERRADEIEALLGQARAELLP